MVKFKSVLVLKEVYKEAALTSIVWLCAKYKDGTVNS